jgi:hypothetical protein
LDFGTRTLYKQNICQGSLLGKFDLIINSYVLLAEKATANLMHNCIINKITP